MEQEEACNRLETTSDDSMPPLMATYKHLLISDDDSSSGHQTRRRLLELEEVDDAGECDLPVIDLDELIPEEQDDEAAAERCRAAIERAASEWGFFMVINHGVPQALLDEVMQQVGGVFRRPFEVKLREPLLDFAPESYRWGTPSTAASLDHLSWSEAYHIPLGISAPPADDRNIIRLVIEDLSTAMWQLANRLARILVAGMSPPPPRVDEDEDDGEKEEDMMMRTTRRDTCFLRLNRYPPCAAASRKLQVFGLCPHTDSDFLTIVHQDGVVGGLQILHSGRWLAVRPRPGALIVNVGDLLQAWSNDLYRSVEHRVVTNAVRERFSVAFFLCPSYDTLVRPIGIPPIGCSGSGYSDDPPCPHRRRYASFTFGEYRNRVTEDVRRTGRKLGLQPFRLDP